MSEVDKSEVIEQSLRATDEGRAFLDEFAARIRQDTVEQFAGLGRAVHAGETFAYDPKGNSSIGKAAPSSNGDPDLMEVMRTILHKITVTREELHSISESTKGREFTHFNAVEDELSAITFDTERATNTIIDATDDIEHRLRQHASEIPEDVLSAIKKGCHEITMACSFQDICSQRVKKVVEVVQLIDAQVANIERRLGTPLGEDIRENPQSRQVNRNSEKEQGLLQGPALPNQSVDQDAIDSIFDD